MLIWRPLALLASLSVLGCPHTTETKTAPTKSAPIKTAPTKTAPIKTAPIKTAKTETGKERLDRQIGEALRAEQGLPR